MNLITYDQQPDFYYITETTYPMITKALFDWIQHISKYSDYTNLDWLFNEDRSGYLEWVGECIAFAIAEQEEGLDANGELEEGVYERYWDFLCETYESSFEEIQEEIEQLLDNFGIMYANEKGEVTVSKMRNSALQSIW